MIDSSIPLADLLAGQSAHVTRVVGDPDDVCRLEEFGVRRGTRIQMFRRGSPCIVCLDGNKVCVRADGQLRILVRPE